MLTINQDTDQTPAQATVLRFGFCDQRQLAALLKRFGLAIQHVCDDDLIPGSFWGDEEAGLIDNRVLARPDTPLHSILHEASHYICMSPERRTGLHTNAGGNYDEENAVCYLQVLLATHLTDMGRDRMFSDMDAWGYSFRLGSARRWFQSDAEDARSWLQSHQLINGAGQPTWRLRA